MPSGTVATVAATPAPAGGTRGHRPPLLLQRQQRGRRPDPSREKFPPPGPQCPAAGHPLGPQGRDPCANRAQTPTARPARPALPTSPGGRRRRRRPLSRPRRLGRPGRARRRERRRLLPAAPAPAPGAWSCWERAGCPSATSVQRRERSRGFKVKKRKAPGAGLSRPAPPRPRAPAHARGSGRKARGRGAAGRAWGGRGFMCRVLGRGRPLLRPSRHGPGGSRAARGRE